MFHSTYLSHDNVVKWLLASLTDISLENITNAFLVSLSTRRLELRSALGSFAIAKNFPAHVYQGEGYGCTICGEFNNPKLPRHLRILNFKRYKWGGVMHEWPKYVAFDLEQFAKLDKVEPLEKILI